ncbi:MAG: toxin-antitoxin system HicB family antitoxin [Actinobacteria bacterium]|nr:toxin-antitoxin system HicB family antitoxin [Actinomycetota bacterium]
MQLTPYLEAVARDLDRATALADDQTRELTHRVTSVMEPGLRLAMVQLLSDAAAQLTAELDGPVVTVRMEGRDPRWHIVRDEATLVGLDAEAGEDDNSARVTVRLPEAVKKRAEAAAQNAGQSLNTWIVQTLRRATTPENTSHRSSRRITGWA